MGRLRSVAALLVAILLNSRYMKPKQVRLAVLLVLIIVSGLVWWKRIPLQDWWRLRGYTPPRAVVQLANQDTMDAYTRHLFYLNKPQLPATVTAFRAHCPENQNTIVLGCYHPDQAGIYIYAVSDRTLAGIQQVTAAHEVLHAVYARLSGSARKTLDAELQAYYDHGLTDTTVKAEVALYKRTEPGAVYDEMSCTFGTELAQLPAALTAYYARYFTDRQKIVGYEQQYQGQFTSRQQQISSYDAQLAAMKARITSEQSSLGDESEDLTAQQARLQQLLTAGQIPAYNSSVAGYDNQVTSYNAGVATLKQEITAYNQLVAIRNTVAGQLSTLDGAIDTRTPAIHNP